MMEMVKVKVSDLTGAALDWAVAKAEQHDSTIGKAIFFGKLNKFVVIESSKSLAVLRGPYKPSSNWHHCGPLIDKYAIAFDTDIPEEPIATCNRQLFGHGHGETHLVAACRAIVTSHNKHYEFIEVPAVLVEGGE